MSVGFYPAQNGDIVVPSVALNINRSALCLDTLGGRVLRTIHSEIISRLHPHSLSLTKDVKLLFSPYPPGIEHRAVAWQSITLPLRQASYVS